MADPQWDFGQDYEVLGTYPAGAGGVVWLVRARQDGAERAIKIIHPELTADAEAVDELRTLLGTLGQLGHPGILVADKTVVHEGLFALVMERMPGEDLRTLLDRGEVLASASAALIVADVCDALAGAHAAGIVHGDVKPSNVLVHEDADSETARTVRLADFGIAALAARSGVAALPSEYHAPDAEMGPAADVYAVGAVLYEALSGRPPFADVQVDGTEQQPRAAQPLRIPGLPDELWLLIVACLAAQAEQRPTAAELAVRLREMAPRIAAASASATQETVLIERIAIAPVRRVPAPVIRTSAELAVATAAVPAAAVQTAVVPIKAASIELADAPRRSALRGPRGIALAVSSGAVVVVVALVLMHASSESSANTSNAGLGPQPALALGSLSAGSTSTMTATLTPTSTTTRSASASPTPDASSLSASATATASASSTSSSVSVVGSPAVTPTAGGAPVVSTTPTSGGSVTVSWQCATNTANPYGISKTSCIGLGSDGALYIRGTFSASSGTNMSDIRVTLIGGGRFYNTASESCDSSSCSITGGPYTPSAGTYQAYAGVDGSSHNEASPSIEYQGG